MSTLQSEITEAKLQREQDEIDIIQLERRAAMGELVTGSEINVACTRAGRTEDDFASGVKNFKFRESLRRQAAEADNAKAEQAALVALLVKANAALEEAVKEHGRVTGPIQERRKELTKLIVDATVIDNNLMTSCPCPKLNAEARRLRDESARLTMARKQAAASLEDFRAEPHRWASTEAEQKRILQVRQERLDDAERKLAENLAEQKRNCAERIAY